MRKLSFLFLTPLLAFTQNMLQNPSFEEAGKDGIPASWNTHCTGTSYAGRTEETQAEGKACGFIVKIADEKSHVSALDQIIIVEPDTEYMLSAIAKGQGTLFGYEYDKDNKWIRCVPGAASSSNEWQPLTVKFKTSKNAHFYHVRFEIFGKEREGKGWVDNIYFGKPVPPPQPPANITARLENNNVRLTWTKSPNVTYRIHRSRFPDLMAGGAPIASTEDSQWLDTAVPEWSRCFYRITAIGKYNIISEPSSIVEAALLPKGTKANPIVWTDSVLNKVRRYTEPPAKIPAAPQLEISLAQNEVEARQILIYADKAPISRLNAAISQPTSQNGQAIDSKLLSISPYEVRYTSVAKPTVNKGSLPGLYPDPLPPMTAPVDIPLEATQSIWIQARTAANCPAGIYKATVTLTAADGFQKTIPLSIEVFGFALPEAPSFMSAFAIWNNFIAKAFDVKHGTPEYQRLVEKYYWFMVDRRMPPDDLPVNILSPEAARYLNDPRINSFRIPSPWGRVDTPGLTKILEHIRKNGWLSKGYIYNDDEPSPDQYPQIVKLAQEVHKVGKDIPFLMTVQPVEALYGAVDIWCPVLSLIEWDKVNARRAKGERLWWYTCCGPQAPYPTYLIDDVGTSHRVLSWLQVKHKIEGVLYWCINVSSKYRNGKYQDETTVWEEAEMFPNANGDGFLIYPGSKVGIHGPVSSVRLEIIRDGNEDVEYFNIYRKLLTGNPNADKLIEELITPVAKDFKNWTKDPEAIDTMRKTLAQKIIKAMK